MSCEINITQINGQTCDFQGCNSSQQGQVSYTYVEDDVYHFTGTATDGTPLDFEETVPSESSVSPSKIFQFIVKKAKEYLCPQCM